MPYLFRPLLLLLLFALLPARQTDPPPGAELVIWQTTPDEQNDYLTLETAFTPPGAAVVAAEYRIGGQVIPVDLVDAAPEPFYVALLIDTSGSMSPALEATRRAAMALVEAAPPQAHFAVITFDSRLSRQLYFSDDRAAVVAALAGLPSSDSGTCLYDFVHATLDAVDRYTPAAGLTTATANARRAVVLFSDGRDELRADQPEACSRLNSTEVAGAAGELNIPIYTVYAAGRAPGRAEPMAALARASGGRAAALADTTLPDFFDTLIAGFTRQWRATGRFYLAPAGRHAGQLVAMLANGRVAQGAVAFDIARPHQPTPILTLDDHITYQEATRLLGLSVSFHALPALDALRVEIIDRAGDDPPFERTIPVDQPPADQPYAVSLNATLRRNHAYQVQVTALTGEQPILTSDNQTVSADQRYYFQPPAPAPVDLRIEGVTLSPWQPGRPQTVTAQVGATSLARIATLDGYLVRQPDGDASPELYRFQPGVAETITTPLPGGGGRYTVVLIALSAQGDYLGTAVQEFDTSAGWLERDWQTLKASPWLLAPAVLLPLLALLLIGQVVARQPRRRAADPSPDASPPPAGGPRLRVADSPQTALVGQTVPLTSFPFTIGREGCSLNLPDDKQLSRRHAQITAGAGSALYLSDMGSGHGTLLDGRRLAAGEEALLAAQRSVIQVGKATTLVFEQSI